MTVKLDLNSQEEARLVARANEAGLSVAQLLQRMIAGLAHRSTLSEAEYLDDLPAIRPQIQAKIAVHKTRAGRLAFPNIGEPDLADDIA